MKLGKISHIRTGLIGSTCPPLMVNLLSMSIFLNMGQKSFRIDILYRHTVDLSTFLVNRQNGCKIQSTLLNKLCKICSLPSIQNDNKNVHENISFQKLSVRNYKFLHAVQSRFKV